MENLQMQLIDCREALRQFGLAKQRDRLVNIELHAQCRSLRAEVHQTREELKASLHKEHGHYVTTHQVLQHSERSRSLLERRLEEQWQMLINLVDLLHSLRLKLDDDKLFDDEKKVDIIALFVDKEALTSQIDSLKQLLIEMQEALKAEVSRNKKMQAKGTEMVKIRDQRIMKLKRNIIRLKQEQRKHKTYQRKVDSAWRTKMVIWLAV